MKGSGTRTPIGGLLAGVLAAVPLGGCVTSEPVARLPEGELLPNPWDGEPLSGLSPEETTEVLAAYLAEQGFEVSTVSGDRLAVVSEGLLVGEVMVFGSEDEGTRNIVYREFDGDDPSERLESFDRARDSAGPFEWVRELVFAVTQPR